MHGVAETELEPRARDVAVLNPARARNQERADPAPLEERRVRDGARGHLKRVMSVRHHRTHDYGIRRVG